VTSEDIRNLSFETTNSPFENARRLAVIGSLAITRSDVPMLLDTVLNVTIKSAKSCKIIGGDRGFQDSR
jgi:hypothetical protein